MISIKHVRLQYAFQSYVVNIYVVCLSVCNTFRPHFVIFDEFHVMKSLKKDKLDEFYALKSENRSLQINFLLRLILFSLNGLAGTVVCIPSLPDLSDYKCFANLSACRLVINSYVRVCIWYVYNHIYEANDCQSEIFFEAEASLYHFLFATQTKFSSICLSVNQCVLCIYTILDDWYSILPLILNIFFSVPKKIKIFLCCCRHI